MSKRRVYLPSETNLALYPATSLIKCSCGVLFPARAESTHDEDDPNLCLPCNRRSWSRLINGDQPVATTPDTKTIVDVSEIDFDLISDSDVGSVVPIWRPRR